MDKQSPPFDLSRDVTVAADGMEQLVDNQTLFCTPAPLAASTVNRAPSRSQVLLESKGSFLDDMSRLSLQSVSALDLTNQLKQLNLTRSAENSPRDGAPAGDSGPDLIQFSGATNAGDSDAENNKSDSQTDVSSRSSMGLIPTDMLSDCELIAHDSDTGAELSQGVLPLGTPKAKPAKESSHREQESTHKDQESSHSTFKEKTADSNEWSDSSRQDSKQDSKDIPLGRSHLETVKKRPQPLDRNGEGTSAVRAARGALSLFAGRLLDNVQEGEELEQSVHTVEFGDDDLRQLDVDFSDLEEDHLGEARESGDEDFDFDEPMLALPVRERVERKEDAYDRSPEVHEKTLQAELAEAECRIGEGQESDDEGGNQTANSSNDFGGLDSRYFRKTPMPFAGDGEDAEMATSRTSIGSTSQQRGAAEGEHLLTKLRRQFMSGDGSENEIDTDDELEAARMSLAMAARERGQGADEEDTDRSRLPLPVGLEDARQPDSGNRGNQQSDQEQHPLFSYTTRQSAEGDAAYSPVPWSGGGGGDGSSGGDSDGGGRSVGQQVHRPPFRYVSGAAEKQGPASGAATWNANMAASTDDQSGLCPEFFLPTACSSNQDSRLISPHTLEGSTFNVEDIFPSEAEAPSDDRPDKQQEEEVRLDASGFNAEDAHNPFEDQFAGSFGSFELDAADNISFGNTEERSTEVSVSTQDFGGSKASSSLFISKPQPGSGSTTGPFSRPLGKGSGSFDGPFRKPRALPPSKKKKDKEASVSRSNESWKNATFQDQSDDELAQELRELGINVEDDGFLSSEAAEAMLDAHKKQFEEEKKFKLLSFAAEGLEVDDSHFSGILEGEENPHVDTSIGTYMAARTEVLGTLDGDPQIPRPQFGKPLHSPPRRPYPVKLISTPFTASSVLALDSRSDGVGNEDGDRTMTPDEDPHGGGGFRSPKRSPTSRPGGQESGEAGAKAKPGHGAAEASLRAELSTLLMDLTNNSIGDLSLEDGLSTSTVSDFIKNHSFSKSFDFASAIMKLAQAKKPCQGNKATEEESKKMEQSIAGTRREDEQKRGVSKSAADDSGGKSAGSSSSTQSTPRSTGSKTSPGISPSARSSSRGSKLPVRRSTAAGDNNTVLPERTDSLVAVNSLSKRKSLSVSQIPSHPELRDEGVTQSWDDSFISKQQNLKQHSRQDSKQHDLNRKSSDQAKMDFSKVIDSQRKSGTTRESARQDALPSTRNVVEKDRVGSATVKHSAGRSSEQVNTVYDAKSKSHVGVPQTSVSTSADRPANQEQNKQKLSHNVDLSHEHSKMSKKFKPSSEDTNMHQQDFPMNIPPSAHKGKPVTREIVKENATPGIGTPFSTGYHREPWRDVSQNVPSHIQMQSPPQKLSVASKLAGPKAQELCSPMHHDTASSNQSSPSGTRHDHHVPDGMDSTAPASAGIRTRSGAEREQAVGGDLKSHLFDMGKAPQDLSIQGTKSSPKPVVQREPMPTLLTGTSLLNTDFAQKYFAPKLANQRTQEQTEQPSHNFMVPHDVTRGPQSYVQPEVQRSHSSCTGRPHFASQAPQPPNATIHTMDESAMSVYYELNEDPHQTTLQGGETTMGSFWGKSPLYQSTPAFEVGKVAAVSMMGSRLDERELTTPGTNMVTPRVQRQLIDMQRNVDFPEFCCLGVSQKISLPVTNRTAFGVVCRFSVVRLVHNGQVVNLEQQNPFELKPKISISAGASETLPVLFVPKRPGEHVCQVEVFAQSMNPTLEPVSTITQLRAVAEVPHIQIYPSADVVHLGEVMWGGCVSKVIKLRNVKRASLPVRLSIWSASSVWHCFSFDKTDNLSEVSIISMSSRPESLGRNVTTVILPGCDSPDAAKTVEICIYCKPPVKEMNRALAERPAEKIEAKINVEVDTPVQFLPPLATMLVKATVGMPRLLIPPSNMSMAFKTEVNKNIQDSIMVTNAGNISMDLALSVTTFPQCFKVTPSHLSVKPGASAEVAVTFSPLETDVYHYQSLLLLDLEPEGPSYEIAMEATVCRPSALRPSPLNILVSKSCLSFNGVPLNQTKSMTVRLLNKDVSRAEHACVEVKQPSDCFKLVSASGEWQQKCELAIEPQQKVTLTVIFCPTAVRGYSGKLTIRKSDGRSAKYSVPLSGYGGRSVLALSGARLTKSGQQWLELGSLSVGHIMREMVLTNSGVRAAFVRATAFYDMPCKQPVPPGRVTVEPNNFVLATGCSMKVMVAISPSQREVELVRDRTEVVAVVRFQHGDEVMRQKYQRASNREGVRDQHTWQAAFRQHFTNEVQDSITLEGHTIPDSPDDSSAFFHHLSSQHVALLAVPQPQADRDVSAMSVSTVLNTAARSQASVVPTREKSSSGYRPSGSQGPVRDESRCYDSSGQFLVPRRPDPDEEKWTVKPDFLSLSVGDKTSGMVQLINFSRQPLRFEVTWPPGSVIPEPQKGEVQPRSSTSVEVWLHTAWQKRLSELPWRGEIIISCNGQEQNVRVHIQNTVQPSLLMLSSLHSSPVSASSVSARSPRDTTLVCAGRSVQLAATNVHFPNAKMNGVHESVLELTNTSTEPVHWEISAFAPAYVKGADSTNTVQRVGHSVFTISPTSADLLPQETMKVPVKFCPKTKGTFNQHWEVEYYPLTTGRLSKVDKLTTKISFTAEVTQVKGQERVPSSSRKPTWDTVEQDKSIHPSSRAPLQEKHSNTVHATSGERVPTLQLMDQEVTFSSTKVGQVTQVRVELKNSYDHNVEMQTVAPKPPFRIKHKNFKITKKRFLKYPIEFAPTSPGSYEDTMTFKAPDLAKTFTLRLKGTGL